MGIDLRLFIPAYIPEESTSTINCNNTLRFDRYYELFDRIRLVPDIEQFRGRAGWFIGYDDEDPTTECAYGSPLYWVRAEDLGRLTDGGSLLNDAILIMLSNLDPETPVALYWC